MSLESVKKFVKRLNSDLEFKKKIGGAKGKEERMKIIKEEGFDFTSEEINKFKEEMSLLTEEELEGLVGGSLLHCWLDGHCGQTCENDCGKEKCLDMRC